MTTQHTFGDMAFIRFKGRRVAKCTSIDIRDQYRLAASEPIGEAFPDEIIMTGVGPVEITMTIEQLTTQTLEELGITPKHGTTLDVLNHPDGDIVVESVLDGSILDRVVGFKPESVSKNYRKGELTVFDVTGQGTKHTGIAEN